MKRTYFWMRLAFRLLMDDALRTRRWGDMGLRSLSVFAGDTDGGVPPPPLDPPLQSSLQSPLHSALQFLPFFIRKSCHLVGLSQSIPPGHHPGHRSMSSSELARKSLYLLSRRIDRSIDRLADRARRSRYRLPRVEPSSNEPRPFSLDEEEPLSTFQRSELLGGPRYAWITRITWITFATLKLKLRRLKLS